MKAMQARDEGFAATLGAVLAEAAIPSSGPALAKAAAFQDLLVKANATTNLTAITGAADSAVKHFADSLALLKLAPPPENGALVDIGAGSGFPGLALGIFRPDLRVTLLESIGKKCRFLEEATAALSLSAEVYCGRAEEMGREDRYREHFQVATARAVADFRVLLEYALPLLAVGGRFCCYKGAEAREEIAAAGEALKLLGGVIVDVRAYTLPRDAGGRSLYIVEKVAPSDEKYPRRIGIPLKRPL